MQSGANASNHKIQMPKEVPISKFKRIRNYYGRHLSFGI